MIKKYHMKKGILLVAFILSIGCVACKDRTDIDNTLPIDPTEMESTTDIETTTDGEDITEESKETADAEPIETLPELPPAENIPEAEIIWNAETKRQASIEETLKIYMDAVSMRLYSNDTEQMKSMLLPIVSADTSLLQDNIERMERLSKHLFKTSDGFYHQLTKVCFVIDEVREQEDWIIVTGVDKSEQEGVYYFTNIKSGHTTFNREHVFVGKMNDMGEFVLYTDFNASIGGNSDDSDFYGGFQEDISYQEAWKLMGLPITASVSQELLSNPVSVEINGDRIEFPDWYLGELLNQALLNKELPDLDGYNFSEDILYLPDQLMNDTEEGILLAKNQKLFDEYHGEIKSVDSLPQAIECNDMLIVVDLEQDGIQDVIAVDSTGAYVMVNDVVYYLGNNTFLQYDKKTENVTWEWTKSRKVYLVDIDTADHFFEIVFEVEHAKTVIMRYDNERLYQIAAIAHEIPITGFTGNGTIIVPMFTENGIEKEVELTLEDGKIYQHPNLEMR